MIPAACPNCSGRIFESYGIRWVISRPGIYRGQNSKKWFIAGCCEFSQKSHLAYETEEEALAGWERYREAKGKPLRGEEFFNSLTEYDNRLERRLAMCTTGNTPVS